jgi:hypothetical protein
LEIYCEETEQRLFITKNMDEQQIGELAFKLHQELTANEMMRRGLLVKNIEILEEIFSKGLYRDLLGDPNAEWAGYLGSIDVFYSRAEVNRWLKIKKVLADKFGFNLMDLLDIPVSRLATIASVAGDAKQAEELIGYAKTNLPRDWKDLINKLKGKNTIDDGHAHDFKRYEICRICGFRHAITEEHTPVDNSA